MRISLLIIFVVIAKFSFAQDSTLFIAAGQEVSEVLTPQKIFRYPQFISGEVLFRDNTTSHALLNYNYLLGEIEFISPKKDTLALAKEQMKNIKKVIIDTNTFFYNRRYVELVMENGAGKLFKSEMYYVVKREKIGGYNQPSSTSAIESYENFTGTYGIPEQHLKIRENITLVLKTNYFFGNDYDLVLPANKKNLYKVCPAKKDQIDEYLKENSVDYKNPSDLKKLLNYLVQGQG
ncbi:MAG: hypothetical protein ABI091_15825 [Ferruginibacter sp.]